MRTAIKTLCLILAAAIAASSVFIASASYSGDPDHGIVTVAIESGKTGEIVTATVYIENNPGIATMGFTLEFDFNVLEYVSSNASGAAIGGMSYAVSDFPVMVNNGKFRVTGYQITEDSSSGVLYNINFKVKGGTKGCNLMLSCEEGDFSRIGADYTPEVVDGKFIRELTPAEVELLIDEASGDLDEALTSLGADPSDDDIYEAIGSVQELFGGVEEEFAKAIEKDEDDTILDLLRDIEEKIVAANGDFGVITPDLSSVGDSELALALGTEDAAIEVVGAVLNNTEDQKITKLDIAPLNESDIKNNSNLPIPGAYSEAAIFPLEIKLYAEFANNPGESEPVTGTLAVPITITMPIPQAFIGSKSIIILHYKEGSLVPEEIRAKINENGTMMTFTVTSFSTFVFVDVDEDEMFSVSFSVRSYNRSNPITVQLVKDGTVIHEITEYAPAGGSGQFVQDFTIRGVTADMYTLVVTKPVHTKFVVDNVEVNKDVVMRNHPRSAIQVITLLCGDIDGNNLINASDLALLTNSLNYMKSTNESANPLADLNGDGLINASDLAILTNSINYMKGIIEEDYKK